ncbi:LysR family transcriptional regulator [Pseudomonas sp. WJP1]|uniref:LysR family transcriptional regulator n=1 Tax=Pseudomonas sp. WJP1 TaxID=2986947 RepID=UPI002349CD2F|nr:LysR family transcriptional regulator [Pseudomonas sp. WJP1]WCM48578.1 LysR family transcriptional regulator [Pseudomonas sp. WJP1]
MLLFSAIAKRASFIAAGMELGISPAHVSKRTAALEVTLRCKLFNRTTRRVSITSDGEVMLVWAQTIMDNVNGMLETSLGDRVEPRGTLRISTSHRMGRFHIAPILALLRKRYPKMEVWLELVDRRMIAVVPLRLALHCDGLTMLEPPVDIPGFSKMVAWHERTHRDAGQAWLRSLLIETCQTLG